MSKKPIPELLGDDEYLRQHHVIEISVGALQVFRVVKLDDDNSRDEPITAGELFSGGFFYGADELGADVRKAGFPKYPARVTMAELEKIAEQYVGAAPNIKDPKNLPASYAWVLANFADAEYYRRKFMSENNFVNVWGMGVLMGRIVEWWNWRGQKLDRRAAGKRDSEDALPKARSARAKNQAFDSDWHDDARQEARAMHAKNRKRSRWDIAKELAQKFKVTPRYLSEIIKSAVP